MWVTHYHQKLFEAHQHDPLVFQTHEVVSALCMAENLSTYSAAWTGTFPIGIYTESSDLDILFEVEDFDQWEERVRMDHKRSVDIKVKNGKSRGVAYRTISFEYQGWKVELFAQSIPVSEQYAFRHMVVEGRILELLGASFRQDIIALKQKGVSTEPAFAHLLQLVGDPYEALLALADWPDQKIKDRWLGK